MKQLVFLTLIVIFSRCTDVVQPTKSSYLHIAATSVTNADRAIARKFTRQTGIKVDLFKIGPDTLLDHISHNRYNPGFDLLITEDQRIVYALSRRRLLTKVGNSRIFRKQIRQFNNGAHQWVAVAHNPLVASGLPDSTGNCRYLAVEDFSAAVKVEQVPLERYPELRFRTGTEENVPKQFLVTTLDKLLTDKQLQKRKCWGYLQDKKYLSSFLSISEYAYARNHETAQQFIRYYFSCRNYIAGARHYQPTTINGWASKWVLSLKIRRNHRFDR